MVLKYDTTSANVHDSKGYEPLLDESDEGKELYLDAGYESQEPIVERHRMKPVICEKGHRNHPLTDEQKKKNREKSKTRCLVEHVFGFMEQSMCGLIFRRVGILRARADVAMTCLVYNICRYTQIMMKENSIPFSMEALKSLIFNSYLLDRFFKLSGIKPNKRINAKLVKELIDIAAYQAA